MSAYSIEPVSPKTINQAYLLAKVTWPSLTASEWHKLCRSCYASGAVAGDCERIVVALNAAGYIKGLCLYSVRDHSTYGRLLDIPLFIVASAADAEGAAGDFLDFLRSVCDASVCSGIRFWTMGAQTLRRRLDPEDIERTDHGVFMPALASAAEFDKVLRTPAIGNAEAIGRFSE